MTSEHLVVEHRRGNYVISTDKSRLNIMLIHDFLAHRSYWARGVALSVVQRTIEHSLCFGVYQGIEQVGFARVVTDYAVLAYLMDVFVLEPFRGQGLGKWLVECVFAHPELQGLRRWMLATQDAQSLYARYGFGPLSSPQSYMAAANPGLAAT
jgi:GNAT superfamily N-acetyltransferase